MAFRPRILANKDEFVGLRQPLPDCFDPTFRETLDAAVKVFEDACNLSLRALRAGGFDGNRGLNSLNEGGQ